MDTSRKGKKNKIKLDYGMADYYKFYSDKYTDDEYKISGSLYNTIVSEYNKEIAKTITDEGKDFTIPFRLGILGIRKYTPKLEFVDGKLINKLPINPIETGKLWEKNPEAKEKKIYVRYLNKHSDGFVFSIQYFRYKAKYKNKKIYTLVPKREFKRRIARNIKEKVLDAFLLKAE